MIGTGLHPPLGSSGWGAAMEEVEPCWSWGGESPGGGLDGGTFSPSSGHIKSFSQLLFAPICYYMQKTISTARWMRLIEKCRKSSLKLSE